MTTSPCAIHLISIGGSVMHSLACALHANGYKITGSDDEIYEPSRSKLQAAGLLPEQMGWDASRVTETLEGVVVGMHAKADNPELLRAQELGLPIYSYPEFIARFCHNKQRIVVAGSHGKTTTTALIMHTLKAAGRDFDYLVGAPVPGFDSCLRLSNAPVIIIEGDEYPCSPLDLRPKFLRYNHHIGIMTGVAWDHINFYPNFEDYIQPFEHFADATPKAGTLIYNNTDNLVALICSKERTDVRALPYSYPKYNIRDGRTFLLKKKQEYPIQIFGRHNLLNLEAARMLLEELAMPAESYYQAIASFTGADHRLSLLANKDNRRIYTDYAHAPSKVKATTIAVAEQYAESKLAAILELHTFSSLNPSFIKQYKNTLAAAELALIYINPKVLALRSKKESFSKESLQKAFEHPNLHYITDNKQLLVQLQKEGAQIHTFLFMSSGTFGGLDLKACAHILAKNTNN